jgi:hypothetical protein
LISRRVAELHSIADAKLGGVHFEGRGKIQADGTGINTCTPRGHHDMTPFIVVEGPIELRNEEEET